MNIKLCKYCGKELNLHSGNKRNVFCSLSCAAKFSNINKIISEDQKIKISASLKEFYKKNPKAKSENGEWSKHIGQSTKNRYKGKYVESILQLSKRTVTKILKRLNIGCSQCGWNKSTCDIHHIKGRKIENPHSHYNLTYVCPNCHRLFHKISPFSENPNPLG
jgi:hypothetical protein